MKQQENTIKGVFDFLAIASDPNKTIDFLEEIKQENIKIAQSEPVDEPPVTYIGVGGYFKKVGDYMRHSMAEVNE